MVYFSISRLELISEEFRPEDSLLMVLTGVDEFGSNLGSSGALEVARRVHVDDRLVEGQD